MQREYGGTSTVLRFLGAWLLLVTGGEPTDDKPDVTIRAAGVDLDRVSHAMTIRVPDCQLRLHDAPGSRGMLLTPPVTSPREVRAFFRDPDGHLLEIERGCAEDGRPAEPGCSAFAWPRTCETTSSGMARSVSGPVARPGKSNTPSISCIG